MKSFHLRPHACAFFSSPEAQDRVLSQFIGEGATLADVSPAVPRASTIDVQPLAPETIRSPKTRAASGNSLICASALRPNPMSIKMSPLRCRTNTAKIVLC
jgi:hypothetical protein